MNKLTGIAGILVDYGGTLDTNGRHWASVFWDQYQLEGIPVRKEEFYQAYVYAERKMALEPIIKSHFTFKDVLFVKIQAQFEYLKLESLVSSLGTNIVLACHVLVLTSLKRAKPLLASLSKQYKLVMVSNFYGNLENILADYHIGQYFDSVVESARVGVRKPDPEIYTLGVQAIDLPASSCVVLGDSYSKDMVPGKLNGCTTIWLNVDSWEEADLESSSAADHIITDVLQLKEFLI